MTVYQKITDRIKPKFWDTEIQDAGYRGIMNYRRIWLLFIFLLALVSLVPLCILAAVNYNLAYKTIRNENHLRTSRMASNARRSVTYFLEERENALKFITKEKEFERLNDPKQLENTLKSLQLGFGGIVDIGLIDDKGIQIQYSGPFALKGQIYTTIDWTCPEGCLYVSDVFLGHRNEPHMIIAYKALRPDGSYYILRASLDIKRLIKILASLEISEKSDAFICNRQGFLQTPSKYYGKLLQKMDLPIPEYSPHTRIMEARDKSGNPILIGYAYIENSPYILMLVKQTSEIMKPWFFWRNQTIFFFGAGIIFSLIIIMLVPGYMVNRIYEADQTRLQAMHRMENSSRLASVGRLAAGVAHEINNPLAIISENAGFIKDLFLLEEKYKADERLMELIDDVLDSVERCGRITKQLLGFARHFKPKIQSLKLDCVIHEVLSFLKKEAEYRNIKISIDIAEDLPVIYSDHGKLQQIFLNLINNAFQAMSDGGQLRIKGSMKEKDRVSISISDDGCGMSDEDVKRIFEPFFSTKAQTGGTGLGLSITYGLVKKLQGDISVVTKFGSGTTFIIALPLKPEGDNQDECLVG